MTNHGYRRIGPPLMVVGAIVLIYMASYLILTMGGAYTPSEYGLRVNKDGKTISAPKWYSWQPKGFAGDDEKWGLIAYFYLPLYVADRRWWHTDDRRFSGSYPVHLHPADVR